MKESYVEGVANHDDPESCAAVGNCRDEVLTGVRAGWAMEPRNHPSRVPTSSREAEGNTGRTASARCVAARRGHRTEHARNLSAREPGEPRPACGKAMAPLDAPGRPEAASR